METIKAGVSLFPRNSAAYKMKRIQKLLTKRNPETFTTLKLEKLQLQMKEIIMRDLAKHKKLDGNVKSLNGITFLPEELKDVKKKK